MAKTWTDQPDVVADLVVLGTVHVHDRHVEIRRVHGSSETYLTFGNLFGSQTIYCPTEGVALEVMCAADRKDYTLKNGARLVETAEAS
jgi:hypothetical protein